MPRASRWTTLALVPLAVFLESAGRVVLQSGLPFYLMEQGTTAGQAGLAASVLGTSRLVGMLLAGLAAIVVGPWPGIVVGSALVCVGGLLLPGVPADAVFAPAAVVGIGHGLFLVSALGALARAAPDHRDEHLRNGAMAGAYFLAALGSALAGPFWAVLARFDDLAGVFVIGGVSAGLAALVGVGVVAVVFVNRNAERPPPVERVGRRHLVVILVVLAVASLASIGLEWASHHQSLLVTRVPSVEDRIFQIAVRSVTGLVVAFALAVVFVVLHLLRVRRVPTLLVLGIGLVLGGAASAMTPAVDVWGSGITWFAAILLASGEALTFPLVYSRITGDVNVRFQSLALAAFMLLGAGATILFQLVPEEAAGGVAGVSAALTGVAGLAFLAAAFPARRWLAPEPRPDEF